MRHWMSPPPRSIIVERSGKRSRFSNSQSYLITRRWLG